MLNREEIAEHFGRVLVLMKCNPYVETGKSPHQNGLTRNRTTVEEHTKTFTDKAEYNRDSSSSEEDKAIKLLSSLGYNVFKFHWMQSSLVDDNSVKVIGYYKINQK